MTTQESIKPLVDNILSNPLQFKRSSMKSDGRGGGGIADLYGANTSKKRAPFVVIGGARKKSKVDEQQDTAVAAAALPAAELPAGNGAVAVPASMAEALKMYVATPSQQDAAVSSSSESESEEFHEANEYVESVAGEEDVGMPLERGSGSDSGSAEESEDLDYQSGASGAESSSDEVSHVSEDEKYQLHEEAEESKEPERDAQVKAPAGQEAGPQRELEEEEELTHKLPLAQRLESGPTQADDISEFYQFNENVDDRGSSFPSRIVKNWGPALTVLKPRGLLNHGVTCYTNAAVQAMIHIPAIQHYLFDILRGKYDDTIDRHSVSYVLAETSRKMWLPQDKSRKKSSSYFINPKKLLARLDDINCMMSEWQQEDSHEYFMSLMSRLQEDSVPRGHKMTESIVYDIFGGLLKQKVACKSCGYVSETEQPFYDLSLHLKGKKILQQTASSSSTSSINSENGDSTHKKFSIEKSIKEFFNTELIKVDKEKKGYVCENCKKTTNALKHNLIIRAPETLLIHLKKFRFNGTSSSKMKQAVSYPMFLDLTEYCDKVSLPVKYQLTTVVVHEGRSLSSGHYIVHCRQPDGSWATYDDEYINKISEKDVLKEANAYYLLYTRLTPRKVSFKKSDKKFADELSIPLSNNVSTPSSSPVINRNKKWKKNIRKKFNH
ncbi:hypothetical protein HG535_0G01380 [Zygotorulaspora mrakii]|uniref:ubiquitinyl hydrolase 1 n=1 Tax=Zygotorulaspora mrakii TaxID=42260 RepID=A0A7H9B7N5_ZYGMR|nr:uncharacterized protein HG535_0G01380 [Zygotorulaspora mrakii]QLG74254.1 hypothetical protein HG535_0G01380 [Zygotorulaspora mrakii]